MAEQSFVRAHKNMVLKLLASLIILLIAIVELLWSRKISQNKLVGHSLFCLLLLCLIFIFFTVISDDNRTTANMNTLIGKNDTLTLRLDSLMKLSNEYERNSGNGDRVLHSKTKELNDKLGPFISLAVKKYPYMKIEDALERLQKEIIKDRQLVHPNAIFFEKKEITQILGGYSLKLFFSSTKNQALGLIAIKVSILGISSSKILDICPSLEGGRFSTAKDSKLILTSGKEARLTYSLMGMGRPVIEIRLSSKCMLHVEGNNELPSFDIEM
jgi:hypothetical protein